MRSLAASICLLVMATFISSQDVGVYKTPEYHLDLPLFVCTAPGSCVIEANYVALDVNWRWVHKVDGYDSCSEGPRWSQTVCPDPATCTDNCVVEVNTEEEFAKPYGVTLTDKTISIRYFTIGDYGNNIGNRMFMLDRTEEKYRMFNLLNKEFAFTVDVSTVECGLKSSLKFVGMDADGGISKYPTNKAGASLGTGFCDASCSHENKWINGFANSIPYDATSGLGHFGSCCAEFDIWEANKYAQAFTTHPCTVVQQTQCEGVKCGDTATGDRYKGICDKDGCDFYSYRLNNKTFFGPGSQFQLDTTKPMTVVTQFLTDDGTDNGDLVEIRRFYVQDGRKITNTFSNWPKLKQQYDSITDAMCDDTKRLFGDINDHKAKGGLKQMGMVMKKGMVLGMSLLQDFDQNMLWLDPNEPGVSKGWSVTPLSGPCSTKSGVPSEVKEKWKDAVAKFGNIKLGPIGSTTSF